MIKTKVIARLVAASISAIALTAHGQYQLEEVVVTSQKRTESLSDVPISVNVMSGQKISEAGITNLNDLSDFVPNLSMNQTGIGTNISIRGISSGINPAFEQSVGLFVDDVYYGRAQLARVPYLDLARVEVLRGPQPILFGKNAIAGAISMITEKASTEEQHGFLQGEYNFDQAGYDVSGAVNVPLSDTFAVRLSGLVRDQDGYYENTTQNRDESQLEQGVFRTNFHWEATDNLTLDLKYEYASFDSTGRFLEIINPVSLGGSPSFATAVSALTGGSIVLDTTQDFRRQSNGDINETNNDNITLNIDWAIGEHTLTSISSMVEYDDYQQCDCDFTSANLIDTSGKETFEQRSQEFRLTSPGGETVDYIAGVFYQTYDVTLDDITIVPTGSLLGALSPALPGTGAKRNYATDSDLWSAFAQFTWNISDSFRLTVGGRYSDEEKTGSRAINIVDILDQSPVTNIAGQPITGGPAGAVYHFGFAIENEQFAVAPNPVSGLVGHNLSGSKNETKFTPAINAQWDVSDNVMLYASATEGFKAGGFDARANNTGSFEFEGEEATSYELGAKLSLAGGAAELNIAAYRTEYTDLQTSQFDGILGFNVTNAGEATTQGIELDSRWQAAENLTLTAALGWLDFEFDSFPNSQCYFGEVSDYATGEFAGLCDRSGESREFTPELTFNVGADYSIALGDAVELTFGLDAAYSDEYFVSPTLDPNLVQESYIKVNGRIGLAATDGRWNVAVVVENITDEEILTFGNQAPVSTTLSNAFNLAAVGQGRADGVVATAYYGFYEAPMNVSLQARYNF